MIVLGFGNVIVVVATGEADAWLLISLGAAPLALPLVRTVRTRIDGPALNRALADAGRLLAVFSILLSAGLLLSG
jgi:1,4-dihydroxy-2-naphthoate octaprenyltransferase